jgi:hypothetical protein
VLNLEAVGLQMVETQSHDAATSAEASVAANEERSAKRQRSRRPRNPSAETAEPLIMVETHASEQASENAASSSQPDAWGPPSNPRRRARPASAVSQAAEPLVMVETGNTEKVVS